MSRKAEEIPMTPAIRQLRAAKADFVAQAYTYIPHGGTAQAAKELGIDEHCIVKTIVLKTAEGKPFIMLMHGDREISTKKLARALHTKSVELCEVAEAERNSGYHVGGTSPFGFRRRVPVYAQKSIFDLPEICINGGQRGLFVKISPLLLRTVLQAQDMDAGQEAGG